MVLHLIQWVQMYFGRMATKTPETARTLQKKMSTIKDYRAFMPEVRDLPEKMNEKIFKEKFGSVYSTAYQSMLKKIDLRIEMLPIYRKKRKLVFKNSDSQVGFGNQTLFTYLLKVVPAVAGNSGMVCLGNSPVNAFKKATMSAVSSSDKVLSNCNFAINFTACSNVLTEPL